MSLAHEEVRVSYDDDRVGEVAVKDALRDLGDTIRDPNKRKRFEEQQVELDEAKRRMALAGAGSVVTAGMMLYMIVVRGSFESQSLAMDATALALALATVERIRTASIDPVMITGDEECTAEAVANEVGIGRVMADVFPDEERDEIAPLQDSGHRVAMVTMAMVLSVSAVFANSFGGSCSLAKASTRTSPSERRRSRRGRSRIADQFISRREVRTCMMDGETRVWLVERTYSDDEQNMIILTYATPDGERYFRKERALTSFGDVRDTTAAVEVGPENLGTVDEPDLREQYAAEARRMAEVHDPDDVI